MKHCHVFAVRIILHSNRMAGREGLMELGVTTLQTLMNGDLEGGHQ